MLKVANITHGISPRYQHRLEPPVYLTREPGCGKIGTMVDQVPAPIVSGPSECLICGKGPARLHWFCLMFYKMHEWICEECWAIDTAEWKEEGPW